MKTKTIAPCFIHKHYTHSAIVLLEILLNLLVQVMINTLINLHICFELINYC